MANINKIRYNGKDYDIGNNNYSTEEQVIGTWIDGKPLYRKTCIENAESSLSEININIDVDKIIRYNGFAIRPSKSTWFIPRYRCYIYYFLQHKF